MLAFCKCSLILSILVAIEFSDTLSISGINDQKNPNSPVLTLWYMKKPKDIPSEGIFERFLRQLLDVLSNNFSERKINRYCRILSRHLGDMEYRYANRLARHLRYLSRMYRDDLKNEMKTYRKEFSKDLPYRITFLQAMNEVFTLRENQLFDDYIYELKNYGSGDKLSIDEETNKILNDVIVGSILKMSIRDQKSLLSKLRKAVKEYLDN